MSTGEKIKHYEATLLKIAEGGRSGPDCAAIAWATLKANRT